MSSNDELGLVTKIWGPHLWKSLHCISFGFPSHPTLEQKNGYKLFFQSLAFVLPCQYCRESYSHFIKSEPTVLTDDVFDNRDSLTRWVYTLHQRVNKKLDVDYDISFEKIVNKYESFRIKCSAQTLDSTQCVLSSKDKSIAYINDIFVDCPIVSLDLAEKFSEYAKKRGVEFDNIKKFVNMTEDDKIKRNIECNKIINYMKIKGISSIEMKGEYSGLPTIQELQLLSMLCSNLGKAEILAILEKIDVKSNTTKKYKLVKKN